MNSHFFGKLLCVLLAAFTVCYTGWLAYRFLVPSYRTETAFSYTVADSCRVRAVAVRNEQVLTSSQEGVYNYLCEDGEVILSHTAIADVYENAEDLALQNFCDRCEGEIAVLKSAESAALQPLLTDTLNAELSDAAGSIVDLAARKSLDGLSSERERIQFLLGKKLIASGKLKDFSGQISFLQGQISDAKAKISSQPISITAGLDGYFCSGTDGYETIFPSDVKELSVQMVEGVLDGTTKPLAYANAVGKVQKDFQWNLALVVNSEQAENFAEGAGVVLNFGVSGATDIPAEITRVVPEGNETLVVLTCGRLDRYLINVRIVSAEIKFKSYSGLRIPKNALRYIGQTEGVYVKSGNLVEFKPIERLYEGETYVLCSDTSNLENALEQFDEVIVEGTDLYDGKILG